jgi:TRAP-type C4-dicarboxylate transport system permease large subunit
MRVGLVTFAVGLALYVAAAIAQLSYDQPRPGWINPLWLVATLLVVVGLIVMVNTAVRVYRERT